MAAASRRSENSYHGPGKQAGKASRRMAAKRAMACDVAHTSFLLVQACFAMVRNRAAVCARKGRGKAATTMRKFFY